MPSTRPLDALEIRVLGSLLEKQLTTPEQYPMSINSLIAACNQKTNREPLTSLSETQVVEALDRLRLDALTWRTTGARVERWEQNVDRRWHLDGAKKAIMTLLLLRGPQTAGELKSRSERLHDFKSVAEVEATLAALAEGDLDALVAELPRRPGQRENRFFHLAGTPDVLELYESLERVDHQPRELPARSLPLGPSADQKLGVFEAQLAELRTEVATLRAELNELKAKLAGLID